MRTGDLFAAIAVAGTLVFSVACQTATERDAAASRGAGAPQQAAVMTTEAPAAASPLPSPVSSVAEPVNAEYATIQLLKAETGYDCFRSFEPTLVGDYRSDVIERARLLTRTETWVDSGPEWGEPRAAWLGSVAGLAAAVPGTIAGVDENAVWIVHRVKAGDFDDIATGTPVANEYVPLDLDGKTLWFRTDRMMLPKPCDADVEVSPPPLKSFALPSPTPILCEIVTDSCEPPEPEP